MPANGTFEIDLEAFAAEADLTHVIDVRESREYAAGHGPGAILIPLGTLPRSGRRIVTGESPV